MESSVLKIAYIGTIDAFSRRLFRYEYMGMNIISFKPSIVSILGADFSYKIQNEMHYQIWEIDLSARFDALKDIYFKGCSAGIIIFSLSNLEEAKTLSSLVEEVWEATEKQIPVAIIGLKDIYTNIDSEIIDEYNNQIDLLITKYGTENVKIAYFESSMQYGENVKEVFSFFRFIYMSNSFQYNNIQHIEENRYPFIIEEVKNNDFFNLDSAKQLKVSVEKFIQQKCIADRKIINISECTPICSTCTQVFCVECYEFYSENNYECPGSTSPLGVHKPNFQ